MLLAVNLRSLARSIARARGLASARSLRREGQLHRSHLAGAKPLLALGVGLGEDGVEEAEENGLFGTERGKLRWRRWTTCSLCEQGYHGVVYCALGWACWKTYLGRPRGPEADWLRGAAMTLLGNGLFLTEHYADASSVFKARYSTLRRTGASEHYLLIAAGNLANSYQALGRCEEALRLRQEVYSGH